jgi:hypothetical protein
MNHLESFIQELNQAWLEGRYADLAEFFAPDVVMLPPGSKTPTLGVEQMIQSYEDFGSSAWVREFQITGLTIYEWNHLAMCHMSFEIDFELDSGRFQEAGLEVYDIDASRPKPKVVWRSQILLNPAD